MLVFCLYLFSKLDLVLIDNGKLGIDSVFWDSGITAAAGEMEHMYLHSITKYKKQILVRN
jgi:hypothetical protein